MSCYPKLQEGFGGTSHKQYWLVIPQMMEGLRFMFGCARQSFSDSVCISNTGFPDVAVSEHDETESHKSFCASQNTIFLIFLAFCAAQGLALCIKMPNSLARFMHAWVLRSKWAVEITEEKQKTKRKKNKKRCREKDCFCLCPLQETLHLLPFFPAPLPGPGGVHDNIAAVAPSKWTLAANLQLCLCARGCRSQVRSEPNGGGMLYKHATRGAKQIKNGKENGGR